MAELNFLSLSIFFLNSFFLLLLKDNSVIENLTKEWFKFYFIRFNVDEELWRKSFYLNTLTVSPEERVTPPHLLKEVSCIWQ